jgi:hypothetical protein
MQIIRKSSFRASPWKNGGGVTHEVIRVPDGSEAFRWRVSVADIDVSGPFSEFADYRRKMVLLQGAGLRLTFDGSAHADLRDVGDMADFDGAWATRCDLTGGPCTDLNLMVSKSIRGEHAWVERVAEAKPLKRPRATMMAFPLSGAVSLEDGDGAISTLQTWDFALVAPQDNVIIGPAPNVSGAPLVFFAALDDNPKERFIRNIPWPST